VARGGCVEKQPTACSKSRFKAVKSFPQFCIAEPVSRSRLAPV
jgi:hypothetical protein